MTRWVLVWALAFIILQVLTLLFVWVWPPTRYPW